MPSNDQYSAALLEKDKGIFKEEDEEAAKELDQANDDACDIKARRWDHYFGS